MGTSHRRTSPLVLVLLALAGSLGLLVPVGPAAALEGEDEKPTKKIEVDGYEPMDEGRLARMQQHSSETLVGLSTAHFHLYYGIPRIKRGKRAILLEKAAVLYAKRIEEAFDEVAKTLEPPSALGWKMPSKYEIVLLNNRGSYQQVAQKKIGQVGSYGSYRYGRSSIFATFYASNPEIKNDDQLHEKVVHHIGHFMIQSYGMTNLDFPAWVNAGFAHWLEHKIFKSNIFYCFTEVPPADDWRTGGWKRRIQKEVKRRKHLSIADLADLPMDSFAYRHMAYCMSYVEFLIATDKVKFSLFVRELKRNPDTSAALQKTYGWLLGEMEEAWKKHLPKARIFG